MLSEEKKNKRNWSILTPSQDITLLLCIVIVVCHEKNWLEHCPLECRPLYYRRYVDDIFYLFNSAEHLKRFHSSLNPPRLNISFTIENEKDNRMFFLDVNTIREKDKFTTSVYRKPAFSGTYTHFWQFLTIQLQNWLVTYIII